MAMYRLTSGMVENSLPSLAETIRTYDLRADKSLGQHFLLDPHLLARIAQAANLPEGVNVIEVGPGPGGLTRALLDTKAGHITAIEYDKRAVAAITALAATTTRLRIIEADALKADLPALVPAPRAIVANLPYNIGTLLLVNWLQRAGDFQSMTLMFQLEVAERICALPGGGDYGRVSVLTQWLCEVTMLMRIPAGAFAPPPKVESALIRIMPRAEQPSRAEIRLMERVTAAAFGQRRKMLRGALKSLGGEALCHEAGIAPERRAETLSVDEFVRLMRALQAREQTPAHTSGPSI